MDMELQPICAVCYEPIKISVVMPCDHEICDHCYTNWNLRCDLSNNNTTCPFCRRVIVLRAMPYQLRARPIMAFATIARHHDIILTCLLAAQLMMLIMRYCHDQSLQKIEKTTLFVTVYAYALWIVAISVTNEGELPMTTFERARFAFACLLNLFLLLSF